MSKPTFKQRVIRAWVTFSGALVGALIGFYVTLAIVAAKARAGYYLFALEDLASIRIETVTIFLGLIAGAYLAYRKPYRATRALVRGTVALIVGGLLAGGIVTLFGGSSEWAWSMGVVVSALAMLGVMARVLYTAKLPLLTRADRLAAGAVGLLVLTSSLVGLNYPDEIEIPDLEPAPLPPPSQIEQVVLIIGDPGATVTDRTPLLEAARYDVERWASVLGRDSAVSVLFPGDLVYPVGVRDRDHPLFPVDSARLWNEIELVGGAEARRYGARGLFVTGNHDWGNTSGIEGFDRVLNLEAQLELARQRGYGVQLFPPAGEPGPAVLDLGETMRFVFLDTHWFLRTRTDGLRRAFIDSLGSILHASGDRHVVIVSHHPFRSAGPHGEIVPGYHTWGVEYLMRRTGAIVQDLNSSVYAELLAGMRAAFAGAPRPPLLFVGGHDHSLQVIERTEPTDPAYMLVSGAGSKVSGISSLPGMHYGASRPGYMTLVLRTDGAVDLFVVAGEPELIECLADAALELATCMTLGDNALEYRYGRTIAVAPNRQTGTTPVEEHDSTEEDVDGQETVADATVDAPAELPGWSTGVPWWTENVIPVDAEISEEDQDWQVPAPAVPIRKLYFAPDSVTTTSGASYPAGPAHEVVYGRLNRPLWDVPIRLPVLDLDELGTSITVDELTGGRQTVGLRMTTGEGVSYQFRNIVKEASRALDSEIGQMAIGQVLEDQLAAQFPMSARVVAELLQAVDVLVAVPRAVVMPNDPRLGPYRPYFAGRVGWVEERPNEGENDGPGFAGSRKVVGGPEIFEELREDPDSYADSRRYLRTRLVDFLVGDWDRHPDNMRWARFEEDGRNRWEQIPRDRDWAFSRTDGLVSELSAMIMPRYVGFGDTYPPMRRLAASGYAIDHRVLSSLPRDDFMAEARYVQETLTDSVLAAALATLPPPYFDTDGARLTRQLHLRRDSLYLAAEAFFDILSETVHVYGFVGVADTVEVIPLEGQRVHVRGWTANRRDTPFFDRILDTTATQELRLYLEPDTDVVLRPDDLSITITPAPLTGPDDEQRDY